MPRRLIRAPAVRDRTVREVLEMGYLFEEPFVVDGSRIARLGVTATPPEQAPADPLATYREGLRPPADGRSLRGGRGGHQSSRT